MSRSLAAFPAVNNKPAMRVAGFALGLGRCIPAFISLGLLFAVDRFDGATRIEFWRELWALVSDERGGRLLAK